MNRSIIEFLAKNPSRIMYLDKWLCVEIVNKTEYLYTVYQRAYGRRRTSVLYSGVYLETALTIMGMEQ